MPFIGEGVLRNTLMEIIILTGPPSSGINSVGRGLSKKWKNTVRIDVEPLKWKIVNPNKIQWEDQEGLKKQFRDVKNASFLARGFYEDGCNVVIQDWLTQETAQKYRDTLILLPLAIIQLLPPLEEVLKREYARGPLLTKDEIAVLYEQQSLFSEFDLRIDKANLSPAKVVNIMTEYLDSASVN